MKRLDNKGFTLVELIAVIVLLALIMGIGSVSITAVLNNSKKKDYELLVGNIKDASENFYIECKYNGGISECSQLSSGISLGTLVKYGFLTGNEKDGNTYTLINPIDKKNIFNCTIKIEYNNGDVIVSAKNPTDSCPTSY